MCKWLLQNTEKICVNDGYKIQIKMCLHLYYTKNNNTVEHVQSEPGLIYKLNFK